jgi:hypothetical protein
MASDNATAAGLPLAEAAERYATDPRLGRLWHLRYMRWQTYHGSDLSEQQLEELAVSWVDIVQDLRRHFETGALYLAGYTGDGVALTRADKTWSMLAKLDPLHDSATDGRVTLHNVRVFEGMPVSEEPRKPDQANTSRIKSKGTAPATLFAIQAIAALIHLHGSAPPKALSLARRAATRAQELGLPGADSLNPDGSAMRDIARAFLDGIAAADKD